MTKTPWDSGEVQLWEQLAKEVQKYNDIIIGPYLDGRLVARVAGKHGDMHYDRRS